MKYKENIAVLLTSGTAIFSEELWLRKNGQDMATK